MQLLNSDHVKQLFEQEAVLTGSSDGVPAYRAVELFGSEAVQYAANPTNAGIYFNIFDKGDFQLRYLTFAGFRQAASYANVLEIEKSGRA